MEFEISLEKENLLTLMRKCGYAPALHGGETGEMECMRPARTYPRFHLFCKVASDKRKATCRLHLDQKRPSYEGTHAHGGEYEGEVVERERARIQFFADISE